MRVIVDAYKHTPTKFLQDNLDTPPFAAMFVGVVANYRRRAVTREVEEEIQEGYREAKKGFESWTADRLYVHMYKVDSPLSEPSTHRPLKSIRLIPTRLRRSLEKLSRP